MAKLSPKSLQSSGKSVEIDREALPIEHIIFCARLQTLVIMHEDYIENIPQCYL